MTIPSIVATARSLSYYSRLQEVTANNLANSSSDGYKADRMTARSFSAAWPEPLMSLDLRQGEVRDTGRPYDLALETDGFFVVNTDQGEQLTRGGGFEVDPSGFLVDREGHRLLGREGPIHVTGRKLVIESDGTVLVDDALADRLRVETVADPASLRKVGHGRYATDATLETVPDPRVRQGAIEAANVDALMGTVDLIRIQRAYAAGVDAMRTLDDVMNTVAIDVGRP
jgi:flagellar basal body rod protein FlgG